MKYRRAKIIATLGPKCSDRKSVQTLTDFGVNCFKINLSHGTALKNRELIIEGEKFVITGGVPIGSPGTTNYLSVFKP